MKGYKRIYILIFITGTLLQQVLAKITFEKNEVYISKEDCVNVTLKCKEDNIKSYKNIRINSEFDDIVEISSPLLNITCPGEVILKICSIGGVGKTTIIAEDVDKLTDNAFFRMNVAKHFTITYTTYIVGWIYFCAWSACYYPQAYENYRRKSVVGLNLDFVTLNFIGFILYSMFNCGLYFIPEMQNEYIETHPRGVIPVFANDVGFAVQSILISGTIVIQSSIYERKSQKISTLMKGILITYFTVLLIAGVRAYDERISWLDFLYCCNYIKLSTTILKYIPQAYMNYSRKSTEGWAIFQVLLDFSGGVLSTLQMLIDCYNYNDWKSLQGNITKLGMGIVSASFHTLFMIQHFVLYNRNSKTDKCTVM